MLMKYTKHSFLYIQDCSINKLKQWKKKLWGKKNGSHISNGSLNASLQLTQRTALMNGAKTKQQWWQTSQNAIYGPLLPQEKQADFNVQCPPCLSGLKVSSTIMYN